MSIVACHLGKKIGTPSNQILADINAEIKEGEFVVVIGPSGAGKSTFIPSLKSPVNF